jgi:hypothetical protein
MWYSPFSLVQHMPLLNNHPRNKEQEGAFQKSGAIFNLSRLFSRAGSSFAPAVAPPFRATREGNTNSA